jgi:hypothetical protein
MYFITTRYREASELYLPAASQSGQNRHCASHRPLGAVFANNVWRMPQGGRIGFGYLDSLSDADAWQGRNLTSCWVEEAGLYADGGCCGSAMVSPQPYARRRSVSSWSGSACPGGRVRARTGHGSNAGLVRPDCRSGSFARGCRPPSVAHAITGTSSNGRLCLDSFPARRTKARAEWAHELTF